MRMRRHHLRASCRSALTERQARLVIFFLFPYNVRAMEPTTTPKTRRIEVRLSDEERELDAAAASALGESLSDFFRRAAQARAQEVLADQRAIALSEAESVRFLEALEQPNQSTVARLEDLRHRV